MYVVRLLLPDERIDFKCFTALSDAMGRFRTGCGLVYNQDILGAMLFEVPEESNPRIAVEAVKTGQAIILDRDISADIQKVVDGLIEKDCQNGKSAQT